MSRPRLLILSLGGTISMVPADAGGIAPKLGAAELVASVPGLAEVAEIEARSPRRLPSPSLTPAILVEVAAEIDRAFADGFDAAVVIQGTDTIEESAFLLEHVALGICIPRHIQPMACPPFSIGNGGEHAIDYLFEGFGSFIGQEGIHFLGGRRKAC